MSFNEDIEIYIDDPPIQRNSSTRIHYQVLWIDHMNNRHEISIRISSDMIIKDFLQMVIGEFNQLFRKEYIDNFFYMNECNQYELYEPDVDGKPDEELPAYDENQRLRKLSTRIFALKQTILFLPSLMISDTSDFNSCKSPISPRSEENDKINERSTQFYLRNIVNYVEQGEDNFQETQTTKTEQEEPILLSQKQSYFCCCYDDDMQ